MSTTATLDPREVGLSSTFVERLKGDPAYQAFLLLRIAFTVAPIVFGLDKFFNVLVDWETYLAPWINDIVPGSASTAMHLVGVVEIVAGIAVGLNRATAPTSSPPGSAGSSSTCSPTRATTTSPCATSA